METRALLNRQWLALALGLLLAPAALAAPANRPKAFRAVGETVNTQPTFLINLTVDHADHVYRVGETMSCKVVAGKAGYLTLIYFQDGTDPEVLFPNQFHPENKIGEKEEIVVPEPGSNFKIECSTPTGAGLLYAVVTPEPIFRNKNFKVSPTTAISQSDLQSLIPELKKFGPNDWAEARIDLTTVEKGEAKPESKRFAVCIGISNYKDKEHIQSLSVSHLDAANMAKALAEQGQVPAENITLLQNEQASRQGIEQAIFKDLAAKSHAGDTVFIFYSGHGGRCADTTGTEPSGYSEYLVPQDGMLGQTDTMIMDKTVDRWVQELSGRQVCLMFDCCHSGGASKNLGKPPGKYAKVMSQRLEGPLFPNPATMKGKAMGIERVVRRSKDVGRKDLLVLAACQPSQLAWERPVPNEGSVFTYFVLEALKDKAADANQDGKVSAVEAYTYAQPKIQAYVEKAFGEKQDPLVMDPQIDNIVLAP